MYELELPIEKGGSVYVEGEEQPIRPGTVICIRPGQVRHTRLPFTCYYIHFILKSGILHDHMMNLPAFIQTAEYDAYISLIRQMTRLYDTGLAADEILLHSRLLELLYLLMQDAQRLQVRPEALQTYHDVIEKVIGYIQENLTTELSLSRLADYAGFSPIHFHSIFKVSAGQTLHSYVEEQRIKKAVNLLVATDKTLTEIAYECGFSSQSYFSFAFKRKMKCTPREYAKELAKRYEQ